jgi:hypothetical protein
MRRVAVALLLVTSASLPSSARAQAASAASLLSKMEDVSIYPIIPITRSKRTYALTGYGFEFSFKVGEITRAMNALELANRCNRINNADITAKCDSKKGADTSLKAASIRRAGAVADTTFTVEVTRHTITNFLFEASIGSQSTALRNDDLVPGWPLRGRIQEWPILTIYSTIRPDWAVSPYVGASFVPAELKGVKLTNGDSAATIEADASGGVGIFGAVIEVKGFDVFAEFSQSVLRFNTQGWKRPANFPTTSPPPDFLELTGLRFRFGLQLSLGGKT